MFIYQLCHTGRPFRNHKVSSRRWRHMGVFGRLNEVNFCPRIVGIFLFQESEWFKNLVDCVSYKKKRIIDRDGIIFIRDKVLNHIYLIKTRVRNGGRIKLSRRPVHKDYFHPESGCQPLSSKWEIGKSREIFPIPHDPVAYWKNIINDGQVLGEEGKSPFTMSCVFWLGFNA